jgi:hypothetical protein
MKKSATAGEGPSVPDDIVFAENEENVNEGKVPILKNIAF